MKFKGWFSAAFALLVWGVTFANTRALLLDFSALEIMVARFALAWVVLWGMERVGQKVGRESRWTADGLSYSDAVETTASTGTARMFVRGEWLFMMGLSGVFVYQFLENCAIYYTNASNVAILVSFGPIVTAAFARAFTKDRSLSLAVVGGSLIAVCGAAQLRVKGIVSNMPPTERRANDPTDADQ